MMLVDGGLQGSIEIDSLFGKIKTKVKKNPDKAFVFSELKSKFFFKYNIAQRCILPVSLQMDLLLWQ